MSYTQLNQRANKLFGKDLPLLNEDELSQIIPILQANELAETMFGEFGATALSEEELKTVIKELKW